MALGAFKSMLETKPKIISEATKVNNKPKSGWFLFSEVPMLTTVLGALVILGATVWAARREARLAG